MAGLGWLRALTHRAELDARVLVIPEDDLKILVRQAQRDVHVVCDEGSAVILEYHAARLALEEHTVVVVGVRRGDGLGRQANAHVLGTRIGTRG